MSTAGVWWTGCWTTTSGPPWRWGRATGRATRPGTAWTYPSRKTIDKEWGRVTPYLSVINLYNHKNVLFYFYDFEPDPPTRSGVSMIPFLPTLGVEVSF